MKKLLLLIAFCASCSEPKPNLVPEPDDFAVPNGFYKIHKNDVPGASCYILLQSFYVNEMKAVSMSCVPKTEAPKKSKRKR